MITPQTHEPSLAKALGIPSLFLKREDLHPYGSHKGRSIPVMIDAKAAAGARDFVISSSGNAALAALRHVQKRNAEGARLSLSILLGEHVNLEKKQRLLDEISDSAVTVSETKRPLQTLTDMVKHFKKESLRQSTDDTALIGYKTLAQEIAEITDVKAVFIGTSSGTTAEALVRYLGEIKPEVKVYIVQTVSCSPIAQTFDSKEIEEISIADAIIDKVAHRKDSLSAGLKKQGGSGFIVSNEDIRKAQTLLKEKSAIEVTSNGALGLAGLMRALSKGFSWNGSVVCVIGGK